MGLHSSKPSKTIADFKSNKNIQNNENNYCKHIIMLSPIAAGIFPLPPSSSLLL